ncbi:MAG TPA: hypothetical protein VLK29_06455 [Luteimonas sp.]|nr:hypothetical protein [Luteimonas sp.]
MNLPVWAWLYLLVLALVASGGVVASRGAGRPMRPAWLHLVVIGVFGAGVVFFFQRAGAGIPFAIALLLATLVQARRSLADAGEMRDRNLAAPARIGVALRGLAMLPAIALGALAVWGQQGG